MKLMNLCIVTRTNATAVFKFIFMVLSWWIAVIALTTKTPAVGVLY